MNSVDVALACADSNFTKESITGTLAAEVRRQRREIEMLLEQRNDHMKGSADATTACIEYQQVIAELREKITNDGIQIELLEHKLESFREENERLRKDAERYRFLRDNDKDTGLCIYDYARTVDYGSGGIADIGEVIPSSCADKIIDMAIDAARGAK